MLPCYIVLLILIVLERYGCCPDGHHCKDDVCDSITGHCLNGCEVDWNGPSCNTRNVCPTCKWGHCDEDRVCVSGCEYGYYGDTCNKTCSNNCSGKCDWTTGMCLSGCKEGWFGPYCYRKCRSGCIDNQCHRWKGSCKCKGGWYGQKCSLHCEGCLDNNCNALTGSCHKGCRYGWIGATCATNMCRTCRNGSCDFLAGEWVCPHGCISGYWGQNCDQRCPDNCESCQQSDSKCLKCKYNLSKLMCSVTGTIHTTVPTTTDTDTVAVSENSAGSTTNTGKQHSMTHPSVKDGSIRLSGDYMNANTRWYIFICVSVFVAFITAVLIWILYQTWKKHKKQTRSLNNGWDLATALYVPAARVEDRQQSEVFMEVGTSQDIQMRPRNTVGSLYTRLDQPPLDRVHVYTGLR